MTSPYPLSLAQQSALRAGLRTDAPQGRDPIAAWRVDGASGATGDDDLRLDVAEIASRAAQLAAEEPLLRARLSGRGRRARLQVEDVLVPTVGELSGDPAEAVAAQSLSTFDVENGPLWAVSVVHADDHDALLVAASALIADDATLDLIGAALLGDSADLDHTYLDVGATESTRLAQWAAGSPVTDFWADELGGLTVDPEIDGARDRFAREVTPQRWDDVKRAVGSDNDSVVLAALVASNMVDGGHAEQVVLGVATRAEHRSIGPVTNTLPLRITVAGSDSPTALSGQVAGSAARLLEHCDVRGEWLRHRHGNQGRLYSIAIVVDSDVVPGVIGRVPSRPEGVDIVVRLQFTVGRTSAALIVDAARGSSEALTAQQLTSSLIKRGVRWVGQPTATLTEIATIARQADEADARGWALYAGSGASTVPGGELTTENELLLGEAIRSVLELSADHPIGRDDTFFTLGGDSVGALKVVAALGEKGHVVDVESVFTHPELSEIALRMTKGDPSTAAVPTPDVDALAASGLDASTLAMLTADLKS